MEAGGGGGGVGRAAGVVGAEEGLLLDVTAVFEVTRDQS